MNTNDIRRELKQAWDDHQQSRPDLAFERLHNAVAMLVKQCDETNASAARAANVASCLANGINPD